jgi:hypothetical protein
MKPGLLTLVALMIISPLASAKNVSSPEAHPFSISSLNTAFATQGDFEGEFRIFPDRIELRVTKANIYLSEHCPYKGRRLLSGLKFGLVTSTDGKRWKEANSGQDLYLAQVMSPRDTYSLGELYVVIPIDNSIDLSKHWLVAQMEETVLDIPEERERKGYAFAHSCRGHFQVGEQ